MLLYRWICRDEHQVNNESDRRLILDCNRTGHA